MCWDFDWDYVESVGYTGKDLCLDNMESSKSLHLFSSLISSPEVCGFSHVELKHFFETFVPKYSHLGEVPI